MSTKGLLFPLIRASRLLNERAKVALGGAAFIIVFLLVRLAISGLEAFIEPGTVHSDNPYSISDEYGDERAYYCAYSAVQRSRTGAPAPSICESVDATAAAMVVHSTTYDGDRYAYGNCTYWAALRRAQVGEPIPNTWGDAYMWASRARADGYEVGQTPRVGAIMQTSAGVGHVAFVESVNPDGTWRISEMNAVGFDEVDYKTMPASAAANYYFIY